MIVAFEKEYLKELYEKGKTTDKKHRFQPDIIKRFRRNIDIMLMMPNIQALQKYNSLNYELLKGDKQGLSSVRVNDQYRIEFRVTIIEGEPQVTICSIIELSNHYKK